VARIDLFFPIVHGTDGEDGALQGMLRMLGVPFVGSDVLGSALGMDKAVMKRLLRQAGLPVARWAEFTSPQAALAALPDLEREPGLPLFVKPAALGSSVGVSKVSRGEEYAPAIAEAFRFDRRVLVEEAIAGREIECSVLGNRPPTQWPPRASLPGEVIPRRGFYSYAAKYLDREGAALAVPAQLDAETVARVQALSLRVFDALEAEGLARVDLFLRRDGSLIVNEINTLPGFTPISMYPKLWEASGLAYSDLLTRVVDLALERHHERERLQRRYEMPMTAVTR
jgi:D-alanine-D-alanine ligase